MNLNKLRDELSHKERTIDDLINFIQIRNSDKRPNYALFLGAGASVTSGISTGQQLVDNWRMEIYSRLTGENGLLIEKSKIIDYFKREQGSWYNPNNEYSSLFEKKFDLASQRRRFVENQVDKKLPSIGYAYLASLANNNYFNTIFTTNFDDLINEAFYQFSISRPYMCAHDSSIREIPLSSDRPKIIKLHGDYLYDDIKSTLRETESLESNIREKLIESTSELGLIVLGYSGCDRSVLDVLNYLLKSESHLKNGIYWCVREGDEINQDVRKLLWKEKAYFVKVDGFDETLAEIHHGILKELSLKHNFINSKKESIIDSFTKDHYFLKDKNECIRKDIEKIKKHKDSLDISNLLREITEDSKNGFSDNINESDLKNLLNIDKLIKDNALDQAKNSAINLYQSSEETKTKIIYLQRLVAINKKLGLNEAALDISNEIIELDKYNPNHVISKAVLYKDISDRCDFLLQQINNFQYNFKFYNFLIQSGIKLIEHGNKKLNINLNIDSLKRYTEKSLTLDPSLDNAAWLLKLDLISETYADKYDEKSHKDRNKEYDETLEKARKINEKHLNYFKLKHACITKKDDYTSYLKLIEEIIEHSKFSSLNHQSSLIEIVCKTFISIFECEHDIDFKQILKDFLESDQIKKTALKQHPSILHLQIKYYISVAKDLNKASEFIEKLLLTDSASEFSRSITTIYCSILNEPQKALLFIDEIKDEINEYYYYKLKNEIYASMKDQKAFELIEEAYNLGLPFESYCTMKMFTYLIFEKFTEAQSFYELNKHLLKTQQIKDMMLLNYEFSKKQLGELIDKTAVMSVNSRGATKYLKLASLCLQEQKNAVKHSIKELIDQDFENYYTFKSWPIIPDEYLEPFDPRRTIQLVSSSAS